VLWLLEEVELEEELVLEAVVRKVNPRDLGRIWKRKVYVLDGPARFVALTCLAFYNV
jgi:hypothetical protein